MDATPGEMEGMSMEIVPATGEREDMMDATPGEMEGMPMEDSLIDGNRYMSWSSMFRCSFVRPAGHPTSSEYNEYGRRRV